MLTTELIEHILTTIPNRTIGVLGDLFLDRYLDIDPALNEPSVETGLTAYQVTRVRGYPGAAGTVMNNLAAPELAASIPIAAIGDDGEGYELRQRCVSYPQLSMAALSTLRAGERPHIRSRCSARRSSTASTSRTASRRQKGFQISSLNC